MVVCQETQDSSAREPATDCPGPGWVLPSASPLSGLSAARLSAARASAARLAASAVRAGRVAASAARCEQQQHPAQQPAQQQQQAAQRRGAADASSCNDFANRSIAAAALRAAAGGYAGSCEDAIDFNGCPVFFPSRGMFRYPGEAEQSNQQVVSRQAGGHRDLSPPVFKPLESHRLGEFDGEDNGQLDEEEQTLEARILELCVSPHGRARPPPARVKAEDSMAKKLAAATAAAATAEALRREAQLEKENSELRRQLRQAQLEQENLELRRQLEALQQQTLAAPSLDMQREQPAGGTVPLVGPPPAFRPDAGLAMVPFSSCGHAALPEAWAEEPPCVPGAIAVVAAQPREEPEASQNVVLREEMDPQVQWDVIIKRTFIEAVPRRPTLPHTASAPGRLIARGPSSETDAPRGRTPRRQRSSRVQRRTNSRRENRRTCSRGVARNSAADVG